MFSAILTAYVLLLNTNLSNAHQSYPHSFIIEKTNSLQPDQAEISANYLQENNILLRALILQNSTLAESISATSTSSSVFIPSRTAVWVNLLWYLSLGLSVAASMISMSAKRWCYAFVSGRSGTPYFQARLRQRRLDELEHWRMVELLNLLPLLIELSLCKYQPHSKNSLILTALTSLILGGHGHQHAINPHWSCRRVNYCSGA